MANFIEPSAYDQDTYALPDLLADDTILIAESHQQASQQPNRSPAGQRVAIQTNQSASKNAPRPNQEPTRHTNIMAIPDVPEELDGWIQTQLSNPHNGLVQSILSSAPDQQMAVQMLYTLYAQAAEPWFTRTKKRDWMFNIIQHMHDQYHETNGVDRLDSLTAEEFFNRYYSNNRPVVLTNVIDRWQAFSKWTPQYFKERCGDVMIEVQCGRTSCDDYELHKHDLAQTFRFADYVDWVLANPESNERYMTAYNSAQHERGIEVLLEDLDYWPEFMAKPNGNVFVWLGPKGTLTPYHHDLTNNFMVQIAGRKRIVMYPAAALPNMNNHTHCFSLYNLNQYPNESEFPAARHLQPIEIILKPGEFFFLPVGWWHHVEAMDLSITVTGTNYAFDNDFMATYPKC